MAAEDTWKYEQIAGELRDRIRSGEYPPGSRLPSKNELMKMHRVSGGPVNEAIKVLRTEGLVETRQGSGMFVCDPLPEQAASEHEVVLNRVDAMADDVRRLTETVTALEKAVAELQQAPQRDGSGR